MVAAEPEKHARKRRQLGAERRAERLDHEANKRRKHGEARLPFLDQHHVPPDAARIECGQRITDIEARVVDDAHAGVRQEPQREHSSCNHGGIEDRARHRAPVSRSFQVRRRQE
jgi:hypothetical protein